MSKKVRIFQNHQLAIELKYLGYPYEDISSKVGISLQTLYKYFSVNGRLSQSYQEYEKEMNSTSRERAKFILEKTYFQAAQTVIDIMNDRRNPSLSLKAAKYVLDAGGFTNLANGQAIDIAEQVSAWFERSEDKNEI